MDIKEFRVKAFENALEKGCDNAEIYFVNGEDLSVACRNGELEKYSVSRSYGINLRVQIGNKQGYAYTEMLENPEELVERAVDNAKAVETEDVHPMQAKCIYESVPRKEYEFTTLSEKEKIALAIELEKKAIASDERINKVVSCNLVTGIMKTGLYNTLGLEAEREQDMAFSYVLPVAEENGDVKEGMAYRTGDGILDVDGCAKEAANNAIEQLGAESVPSGEYSIILKNSAAADLLEAFTPIFSAEAAQKGLSLLNGKEGEVVASDIITIIDNPMHEINPRAFDDEGVPSKAKHVVDKGVLKTLLHNLKTAKKAGVESTSNAGRSASGPIGVSPSVFYIEPGDKSFDELKNQMSNGIIINDVSGLNAGINTVSGDFSLIASGLLVENGVVVRPVEQITIASSFFELMKNIIAIGSDMKFGIPFGATIGSPSLLVKKIAVSGK